MAKVLAIFLAFTIVPILASAEYRAYKLNITKHGTSREILTNFDHHQYPGVYPLDADETIEYVDSWMCWGRQGVDVPPCPDPKSGSDERLPASTP
jgi:hypothetical protein